MIVGGCNRGPDGYGTGSNVTEKTVLRLGTDGRLDPSFGNSGLTVLDANRGVLRPDGKIVVGFDPIVRLFP